MNDDLLTQQNPAYVAEARRHLAEKLSAVSAILEKASAALEHGELPEPVTLTDYAADWPQDGTDDVAPAARRIANVMLIDALKRQGLRVELCEISWSDYQTWLAGRADTKASRAAYAAGC